MTDSTTRTLPPGWRMVRFDQMAENVTERVDDPSQAGVEYYVGLEHLDPESLHIRRWGKPTDVEATKLRFKPGDVIFGRRRAYQRKLAVAEFEGICSAHALVLRAKPETVLPEFLPFFMQSDMFFNRALEISVGSLSPTINWKTLARQEFPLPLKEEQQRIAEVLWAADEAVERSRDLRHSVIPARQAVIDHLIRSADDDAVVRLEDVCRMQNGRPFPSEHYVDSGIRLLRPGNLSATGYFDWSPDVTRSLPDWYMEEAEAFLIQPYDVVINLTAQSLEDGFMGRVCLAKDDDISLLNQRIGRFFIEDQVQHEYLFRCLQTSSFRRTVETRCEGSKIRHLFWKHIADFPIPLPPVDRQRAIVNAANAVDEARSNVSESIERGIEAAKALREQMLVGCCNDGGADV